MGRISTSLRKVTDIIGPEDPLFLGELGGGVIWKIRKN